MAEIGSSYDLHGWAPPRRQEPAIVAPSLPTTNCPRCGRPGATVEEYDSTDQSGTVRRYRLIRCPEGQRVKARHAQGSREPKCQHTREELHVPTIDETTKARYRAAVAAGGGSTLKRLEQATGIPAKSLSGAFAGSPVSPGRLETILRGLDQLEAPEPSQMELGGREAASGRKILGIDVAGGGRDETVVYRLPASICAARLSRPRQPRPAGPTVDSAAPPPQGPADVEAPSVYQLAEQLERLVRELLPQDPGGLLLQAAVRRGGWTGE